MKGLIEVSKISLYLGFWSVRFFHKVPLRNKTPYTEYLKVFSFYTSYQLEYTLKIYLLFFFTIIFLIKDLISSVIW